MEVVDEDPVLLSNTEVLEMLKKVKSKNLTNLATILYETISYLDSSPASTSTIENLVEFSETIKERKYDLSKIEKIQLANLKPLNETELHLIVDNIEERFDPDQRIDIQQLISSTLNKPPDDESSWKKLKQ